MALPPVSHPNAYVLINFPTPESAAQRGEELLGAIEESNPELVEELLFNGAVGNSAWIEAMDNALNFLEGEDEQKTMAQALLTRPHLPDECRSWAVLRMVSHGQPEILQLLLEKDPLPSSDWDKAMQMAITNKQTSIAQTLMTHADPSDESTNQAVSLAIELGNLDILKVVLPPDAIISDDIMETFAALATQNGFPEIADHLQNHCILSIED